MKLLNDTQMQEFIVNGFVIVKARLSPVFHESVRAQADEIFSTTGNLDVGSSTDVLGLMQRLNREQGRTFVIVTHDPQVAALCERIVQMEDGEIVAHE